MIKVLVCDDEGIVRQSLRFIIDKAFGEECQVEEQRAAEVQLKWHNHFDRTSHLWIFKCLVSMELTQ